MAVAQNSYFVRLRPDLSPQEASEFRAFVKRHRPANRQVTPDSFSACVRVDLLHNVFAKLTINLGDGAPRWTCGYPTR